MERKLLEGDNKRNLLPAGSKSSDELMTLFVARASELLPDSDASDQHILAKRSLTSVMRIFARSMDRDLYYRRLDKVPKTKKEKWDYYLTPMAMAATINARNARELVRNVRSSATHVYLGEKGLEVVQGAFRRSEDCE